MSHSENIQLKNENEALKAQLNELISLIQGAPLGTNVCMCGAPMDEHPDYEHSAVDVWDHAFQAFLDKYNIYGKRAEPNQELAYTDPESPNPEIDNRLHQVSGLRAAAAYNDLCQMLGGRFPDCRIQEEAPKAHAFFMAFYRQPEQH